LRYVCKNNKTDNVRIDVTLGRVQVTIID
jgi:hypothetical protein